MALYHFYFQICTFLLLILLFVSIEDDSGNGKLCCGEMLVENKFPPHQYHIQRQPNSFGHLSFFNLKPRVATHQGKHIPDINRNMYDEVAEGGDNDDDDDDKNVSVSVQNDNVLKVIDSQRNIVKMKYDERILLFATSQTINERLSPGWIKFSNMMELFSYAQDFVSRFFLLTTLPLYALLCVASKPFVKDLIVTKIPQELCRSKDLSLLAMLSDFFRTYDFISVKSLKLNGYLKKMVLDKVTHCKSSFMESLSQAWTGRENHVYILLSQMERVASFKGVRNPSSISLLKLCQWGFYNAGEKDTLQCSECGSVVRADHFVSSPSDKKYHASPKCQFAQTGLEEIGSACSRFANIDTPVETDADRQDTQSELVMGATGLSNNLETPVKEEKQASKDNEFVLECDGPASIGEDSGVHDMLSFGSTKSDGIAKESHPFEWIDRENFSYEAGRPENDHDEAHPIDMGNVDCEKLAHHSQMIRPSELTKEQFPSDLQSEDFILLSKLAAKLTAKINLPSLSSQRPKDELELKKLLGSCSIFLDCPDRSEEWIKELKNGNELNEKQLKELERTAKSDITWYYFAVLTNKHIIFDQSEACIAKCECFYDSKDKTDVAVVKGLAVKQSKIDGDYRSYLICQTTNANLIKTIEEGREELNQRATNLHRRMKEVLTRHSLLVSHPHGSEKRISFGKSSVANYSLTSAGSQKMVYCPNKASLPSAKVKDTREVLLYNAPTCCGSSGSPVFTFSKSNGQSQPQYQLTLWIHNGTERSTKLGASVMKCLDKNTPQREDPVPLETLELRLKSQDSYEATPSPSASNESKKENTTKPPVSKESKKENPTKLPASNESKKENPTKTPASNESKKETTENCNDSHMKKGVPPLYPEYFSWEARLASYDGRTYKTRCKHTPKELALGGFFYTGIGDCVRCFYCGLGLKAWRTTDDMYSEHKRSRANCGFLNVCQQWQGDMNKLIDMLEKEPAQPVEKSSDGISPQLRVALLKNENTILKQQQQCKMCFRYLARELFLPCGEIITCEACAGILSKCPSCTKKIGATVTVFLA